MAFNMEREGPALLIKTGVQLRRLFFGENATKKVDPNRDSQLDALKKSATKRSPRRGAEERRGASRRVVGLRSFVSLNVIYFRLLFRS